MSSCAPVGNRRNLPPRTDQCSRYRCFRPESSISRRVAPSNPAPSSLTIAFDGRVDNREELLAELAGSRTAGTDCELVLRAYQRWGEESTRHILGDFAYVVWNAQDRSLFCARDHLGIRPFFYFTDGRAFLWASGPHQFFHHPAFRKRPNHAMIAEYLSADLTSLEETLYQGVLRLPPAHCLRVSAAGISKRRYWDVDLSRQVRHSTDAGYAESFQDVFAEAVRCRFRGTGPVAAELSGGVDSSSVVGMCRTLFQKGTVPERGFETFSLVFPGQACDESAYVRKVVQFCSVTSNEVAVPPDHLWYANCAKTYSDLPDHANFHMSDFASDRAREKGFGVILTGLGGDDWFTGCPPPSRWSRVRRALRPLRHALEGPACRRPPWIPAGFASRVGLGCTARSTQSALRFASQTQRLLYEGLSDPYRLHCLEMKARASARCGVEHRHPLHDRRLIELALALPADQLWRGGESKSVMRRAMAGLVPDAVINRRTKAEFSTTTAQLFASDGIAPIFRSLLIAEQGWVDGPRVAIMYDEFMQAWRAGSEYLPRVWPLSMILGVEL